MCREAQEGFLEEVAHELSVRGWEGMFGTKDTLGHETVDTTCPFSQEERCPFTAATSRGPLSVLPTLETTHDPLQPHPASWEVASALLTCSTQASLRFSCLLTLFSVLGAES